MPASGTLEPPHTQRWEARGRAQTGGWGRLGGVQTSRAHAVPPDPPREVSEGPYTIGGGGVPPPSPSPPDKRDHRVRNRNYYYRWEILLGHSWDTNFWVPDPPPHPLLIHPWSTPFSSVW